MLLLQLCIFSSSDTDVNSDIQADGIPTQTFVVGPGLQSVMYCFICVQKELGK
jgi:hypothetical protein